MLFPISWSDKVKLPCVSLHIPLFSKSSLVNADCNSASVLSRYSPPLKNRNLAIVSSVNPLFSFNSLRWASVSLPWAQIDSYMDCIYDSFRRDSGSLKSALTVII